MEALRVRDGGEDAIGLAYWVAQCDLGVGVRDKWRHLYSVFKSRSVSISVFLSACICVGIARPH